MAAMSTETDDPYVAMIGTTGSPNIAETSVSFATFYHQLNFYCHQFSTTGKTDINLNKIIENMRAASLHEGWQLRSTKEIKDDFQKVLSGLGLSKLYVR